MVVSVVAILMRTNSKVKTFHAHHLKLGHSARKALTVTFKGIRQNVALDGEAESEYPATHVVPCKVNTKLSNGTMWSSRL